MTTEQMILTAASTFIVIIGSVMMNHLKKQSIYNTLKQKKEVVEIVVKAIQQLYGQLNGQEKFKSAREMIMEYGKKIGLQFTDEELELFIESTVKEMKLQFEENWNM